MTVLLQVQVQVQIQHVTRTVCVQDRAWWRAGAGCGTPPAGGWRTSSGAAGELSLVQPLTSPLIGGQAGLRQPGGGVRGAAGHGGGGHVARRAGARGGTWRPGQLEPQPRQTRLLHAVGLGRHHAVER